MDVKLGLGLNKRPTFRDLIVKLSKEGKKVEPE